MSDMWASLLLAHCLKGSLSSNSAVMTILRHCSNTLKEAHFLSQGRLVVSELNMQINLLLFDVSIDSNNLVRSQQALESLFELSDETKLWEHFEHDIMLRYAVQQIQNKNTEAALQLLESIFSQKSLESMCNPNVWALSGLYISLIHFGNGYNNFELARDILNRISQHYKSREIDRPNYMVMSGLKLLAALDTIETVRAK
ncbi:hypothetical protein AYI68_g3454 [Smittium mucronatum]|nr:hypothetical protein AYI68_g3454 [Smittium mucronatum]